MLNRRTCVWFRLLYTVLIVWALSIAGRFVEQTRYERLGMVDESNVVIFDNLYGSFFTVPVPQPPDAGMLVPRGDL